MAAEQAINMAPPIPWNTRQPNQPQRAAAEMERIDGQRDRSNREDDEAEVVDADTAEHVAEAAQGNHQYGRGDQIPHQHPQQITDVARRQGVEPDATEDRRQ
jgi:hypothetical protein